MVDDSIKVFKKEQQIKELRTKLSKLKKKNSLENKYKSLSKIKLDVINSRVANRLVQYATQPMKETIKVNVLGRK